MFACFNDTKSIPEFGVFRRDWAGGWAPCAARLENQKIRKNKVDFYYSKLIIEAILVSL